MKRRRWATTIALAAVIALAMGSALAAPGSRTGGTATAACNDGTVTYTPTTLWPPNHKMQTIAISYAEDETTKDGDMIGITVKSITDDQAAADGTSELQGSGNPMEGLDWGGVGNTNQTTDDKTASTTAQVRAERSGTVRAGRTYDIKVTCSDMGGGENETQDVDLLVKVPHDQGQSQQ